MFIFNKLFEGLSPVTRAFLMFGVLAIIIVILVWPPATLAIVTILGALPAFLTPLAAFIIALRSNTAPTNQSK